MCLFVSSNQNVIYGVEIKKRRFVHVRLWLKWDIIIVVTVLSCLVFSFSGNMGRFVIHLGTNSVPANPIGGSNV